jgi:hypothetical protein
VTYKNNIDAGTATVVIKGAGDNYKDFISETFTIQALSIKKATITLSKTSYSYNGKEKRPKVTVKYGSKKLKKGKDYTVTYKNNIKVGTAQVVITGKGNYKATIHEKFQIQ